MKKCNMCYKSLPKCNFSLHSRAKDGLQNNCKQCMSIYRKKWASDPDNRRRRKLRSLYNLTLDDYSDMLDKQENKCKICGTTSTRNKAYKFLPVDHCHKTGKVRGLLCDYCNVGLGRFEDDIDRLKKAIVYLEKANEVQG